MRFLKYMLAACILLNLCGCSRVKQINDFKNMREPTKITITCNWNSSDNRSKVFESLIDSFNSKNDGVLVSMNLVSEENYLEHLKIDFCSGNDPDIFIAPVNTGTQELADQGKIAPLNEFLSENSDILESFDESALKYVVWNAKVIALPLEKTYSVLFVNQDIMDKYKVPVPSSYEELIKAVETLSDKGITPIAMSNTTDGMLMYKVMCAMITGNIGSDLYGDSGEINPAYTMGAQYMRYLYNAGAFPDNLFTISDNAAEELFISKKAAMIVRNTSFIGKLYSRISASADNTVSIVPFPKMPDTKTPANAFLYGIGSDCIMVSRASYENPEKSRAIEKLLEFLMSIDSMKTFVQANAVISTMKISPPPPIHYRPLMKSVFDITKTSKEIITYTDNFSNEDIWTAISSKMPYFLTGKIDALQLLSP